MRSFLLVVVLCLGWLLGPVITSADPITSGCVAQQEMLGLLLHD
jgi:hypothetical protein